MTAEAAAEPLVQTRDKTQVSQSYWSLVWWKFKRNKLAVFGAFLILGFYTVCVVFPEFFAPYLASRESEFVEAPALYLNFVDEEDGFSLRPFVYG